MIEPIFLVAFRRLSGTGPIVSGVVHNGMRLTIFGLSRKQYFLKNKNAELSKAILWQPGIQKTPLAVPPHKG